MAQHAFILCSCCRMRSCSCPPAPSPFPLGLAQAAASRNTCNVARPPALQVGRMLDSVYRPLGLGAMLALQDGAIALSSLALIAVARSGASGPLSASPLFGLLVVLAMAEKLVRAQCRLPVCVAVLNRCAAAALLASGHAK